MDIRIDDLGSHAVHALLNEHLQSMAQYSPPESIHALDIEALRQPGITFWCAWDGEQLLGCGALKELGSDHAEIKSMRTANAHRRQGVAGAILGHILAVAKHRGYRRLSLETGSMDAFEPARAMYARFGFIACDPFADYIEDRHSVFMTLPL